MGRTIGVVMSSRIVTGLIEGHRLAGELRVFPGAEDCTLLEQPVENLCTLVADQVTAIGAGETIEAIGVAMPGILRKGVVEDSPNLPQLKGAAIRRMLSSCFSARGIHVPVRTFNDADALAAGVAAVHGYLDRVVRVWSLGNGIGFGRYPYREGVWEGGHSVVTLDPKETYCKCGGRGHLEGIMGQRAMRLRFLDMEPEEVFAAAREGDARCAEFVKLWHGGLAAATATSIHLDGPGHFYFTGMNVRFLDLKILKEDLWQMVKMSPLQSYALHVLPESDELGVIGAAASAELAQDR